jgi:Polysaccharide lyase
MRRTRWVIAAGAAALALTLPLLAQQAASSAAAPAAPAASGVLWQADPSRGTSVFEGLEKSPGTITVANDPKGTYGSSFKYETWDNADGSKERCESRGMKLPNGSVYNLDASKSGQTFYLGWRALWNPMPNASGKWLALFQLHLSGASSGAPGAGPYVLRTLGDGQLHFQYIKPDGSSQHIWSAPLKLNTWQTFVIGFKLSAGNDGWTQFWYNGAQQKFTNGSTSYPGPTLMGTHVNVKWGVYRSGPNSGRADAYLNDAKLGTTYASVAP